METRRLTRTPKPTTRAPLGGKNGYDERVFSQKVSAERSETKRWLSSIFFFVSWLPYKGQVLPVYAMYQGWPSVYLDVLFAALETPFNGGTATLQLQH